MRGMKASTLYQLMKNRQNHSLLYNKEFGFCPGSWYKATKTLGISQVYELLGSLCYHCHYANEMAHGEPLDHFGRGLVTRKDPNHVIV